MAGSRKRSGGQARPANRIDRFLGRLSAAATVQAQLAIAFDWLRIAAKRRPEVLREQAEHLANVAHQLDKEAQK
jgi:hypothetical protein